jgi:thiol-disulfide isomerase/thioredoxin
MNKTLVGIVGAFIIIISGTGIYLSHAKQQADEVAMQQKEMEPGVMKDTGMMGSTTGDTMMKAAGTYEPYAPSKLAMASTDHTVVLFFHASWCPTCKALDADIKAHLDAIPGSLTILDVDYDTAADLKKKYGVTMQHTFVEVDAQGNLLKKWTGSSTLKALITSAQ